MIQAALKADLGFKILMIEHMSNVLQPIHFAKNNQILSNTFVKELGV